jgi:transposase
LSHADGQAERFYRELGEPALIGIEATGNSQWFLDLVQRLGHEIRVGDAAKIRASYVRRQSTDKRDAGHILTLLLEKRFPQLWRPSAAMRDQRQLLRHRDKLVEIRTKVKNSLQHLAMNRGMQKKSRLWTRLGMEQFQQLAMPGWAGVRREDLLHLLKQLNRQIEQLDQAVKQVAEQHPQAQLLMTQPGVGPVTALAFVLTIGEVTRFAGSKQLTSYLGLVPSEHSSGSKRRLGAITKQGNCFLRSCWWKRRRPQYARMRVFAKSINTVAIIARKQWLRWQWHASWQCDSTGCYAVTSAIRRSLISRATRGCPWEMFSP